MTLLWRRPFCSSYEFKDLMLASGQWGAGLVNAPLSFRRLGSAICPSSAPFAVSSAHHMHLVLSTPVVPIACAPPELLHVLILLMQTCPLLYKAVLQGSLFSYSAAERLAR